MSAYSSVRSSMFAKFFLQIKFRNETQAIVESQKSQNYFP